MTASAEEAEAVLQSQPGAVSKLRQRTDGRLDRSRDAAILDAALAMLSERGYEATSMNDIAARAGVGKAAIYRRWTSKAALLTDALVYWRPDLLSDEAPDTGSLRGDFDAVVDRTAQRDHDLISTNLVLTVAIEAAKDPDLAQALDDLMLLRGRRMVTTIIQRAVDRGEITPSGNWSLIADTLTGLALMQAIRDRHIDAAFVRDAIFTVILPAINAQNAGHGAQSCAAPQPDRMQR